MLLERFFPDAEYDGIYAIDMARLKADGISGLILDIDNTLAASGEAKPGARLMEWLSRARADGFDIVILSNSGRRRVSAFADGLGLFAVCRASKPSARGFEKAVRLMRLDRSQACMIGDQLFTDVYGAARIGIYAIYVKPIRARELFTVMLKRIPEKIVLRAYRKRRQPLRDEAGGGRPGEGGANAKFQ
jgi:HAD superfamily phosphatase (TIGR01668 family)